MDVVKFYMRKDLKHRDNSRNPIRYLTIIQILKTKELEMVKLITVCLLLLAFSPRANAQTIDFELVGGGLASRPLPHEEDGFTLTSLDPPSSLIAFGATNNTALRLFGFGDDDLGVGNNNGIISVELRAIDASAFDLLSYDVLSLTQNDGQFLVTSSNGGVSVISDPFTTVNLSGPLWQGIDQVEITYSGAIGNNDLLDIDNFVVAAAVPEPNVSVFLFALLVNSLTIRRRS